MGGRGAEAASPRATPHRCWIAAEVDALVEPLRGLHGLADGEAETPRRLLLKRRGGEGRPPPPRALVALDRLAAPWLRPLPLAFGRRRCRSGFVARRAAEDLEPFRLLEQTLRDSAIERHAPQAG